jgi:hypothetical protein
MSTVIIYRLLFTAIFISTIGAQLTRPIDLWNPFGTSTTPRPVGALRADEIIVKLNVGDLIGRRVQIPNVPWSSAQDPLDRMPPDREHFDPNPLPPRNNVSVCVFLGVPYAEPPTSTRRFQVNQLSI